MRSPWPASRLRSVLVVASDVLCPLFRPHMPRYEVVPRREDGSHGAGTALPAVARLRRRTLASGLIGHAAGTGAQVVVVVLCQVLLSWMTALIRRVDPAHIRAPDLWDAA